MRLPRTAGLHIQPGFMYDKLWPKFSDIIKNAVYKPGAFSFLGDDVHTVWRLLNQGFFPEGTVVNFRPTHKKWFPVHTVEEWMQADRDFLRNKLRNEEIQINNDDPLAHLFGVARDNGVELLIQIINESGISPEELMVVADFDMDRQEVYRPLGGNVGALGNAAMHWHRPGYVEILEEVGLFQMLRNGEGRLVTHAGASGVGMLGAYIGSNQLPESGLDEIDRVLALMQTPYEDITAQAVIDGMPAWNWMEWLMFPELRDVPVLISEFMWVAKGDKSLLGRAPKDGTYCELMSRRYRNICMDCRARAFWNMDTRRHPTSRSLESLC